MIMLFGRKKGNYAYVVARVKAKKASIMKDDAYSKMFLMSLPEISRFVGESGYQKEITEMASKYGGVDLIEHATYTHMAKVFTGILNSSKGELYDTLAAVLEKWDIWNLKVILRGKSFGLPNDQIREDFVLAGSLDSEKVEKLLALDSDDEIIETYRKYKGITIPNSVLAKYAEDKNLQGIEDFLDKKYYEDLIQKIDPTSYATRLFQDYVRNEIDLTNLETILKLKKEGVPGDNILEFVISGGKHIDRKLATQLANAESISAMANDLAHLDFYEDIKDALDDSKSLRDIVAAMNKNHISQAKNYSYLYPLSIIPILDFMIHKENEVNNIRIIARGIESGLDVETIKGLLVV